MTPRVRKCGKVKAWCPKHKETGKLAWRETFLNKRILIETLNKRTMCSWAFHYTVVPVEIRELPTPRVKR